MDNFTISQNKFGRCLIAAKHFNTGDKVLDFTGKLVHIDDIEDYTGNHQHEDRHLQVDKDWYRETKDGTVDYVNHSCDPNTAVLIKDRNASLYALTEIKVGDEITFDYSVHMYNEPTFHINCKCGSDKCRGIVKEYTFLPQEVKKFYLERGYVPEYNLYL